MTKLENFLNNKEETSSDLIEPASGSFTCQNADCNEVVYEGYVNKTKHKLIWKCSQGHQSSVVI